MAKATKPTAPTAEPVAPLDVPAVQAGAPLQIDGRCIPQDPGNGDYLAIVAAVADGATAPKGFVLHPDLVTE